MHPALQSTSTVVLQSQPKDDCFLCVMICISARTPTSVRDVAALSSLTKATSLLLVGAMKSIASPLLRACAAGLSVAHLRDVHVQENAADESVIFPRLCSSALPIVGRWLFSQHRRSPTYLSTRPSCPNSFDSSTPNLSALIYRRCVSPTTTGAASIPVISTFRSLSGSGSTFSQSCYLESRFLQISKRPACSPLGRAASCG